MRAFRMFSLVLLASACHHDPYVGTTEPTVVYGEPAALVYDRVTVEHMIVVSREALVERGYVVARVRQVGPNRIIWAKHGNNEVVRVLVSPEGRRIAVRSVREVQTGTGTWQRREAPVDVIRAIDRRMREHR